MQSISKCNRPSAWTCKITLRSIKILFDDLNDLIKGIVHRVRSTRCRGLMLQKLHVCIVRLTPCTMGAVLGSSEHMVLSMPVVKGRKGINKPICKKNVQQAYSFTNVSHLLSSITKKNCNKHIYSPMCSTRFHSVSKFHVSFLDITVTKKELSIIFFWLLDLNETLLHF